VRNGGMEIIKERLNESLKSTLHSTLMNRYSLKVPYASGVSSFIRVNGKHFEARSYGVILIIFMNSVATSEKT
jgi:hypothetical protein